MPAEIGAEKPVPPTYFVASGDLFRRLSGFDDDGLHLAGAGPPESRRLVVFRRGEAGHALLQGGKFDHHETVGFVRPSHDLEAPPAREHLSPALGDDAGHQAGVPLVLARLVDLPPCNPAGQHRRLPCDHHGSSAAGVAPTTSRGPPPAFGASVRRMAAPIDLLPARADTFSPMLAPHMSRGRILIPDVTEE